jgi:dTMP kinase
VNRGALVVLEGIDGSGKSSQLPRLAARLEAAGRDVVATHEPTDKKWGRRIREMARSGVRVAAEEELAWFVEDRRQHVRELIRPSLAAGRIVLSDRYFLSTVAYQGARGLDWRRILRESESEFPFPDLALLFEIDAEAALARVGARGAVREEAFEQHALLERVAEIYRGIERPWLVRIDASLAADAVEAEAWRHIAGVLALA